MASLARPVRVSYVHLATRDGGSSLAILRSLESRDDEGDVYPQRRAQQRDHADCQR